MNTQHYRNLEAIFKAAPVNNDLYDKIDIEIAEGTATLTLEVEEKYFHAMRSLHGSVYFKLLDDAAYFAVNSIVEDHFIVTSSFNINLTRPVTGGKLTAKGTVRFKAKDLYVGEATLYNEEGKEVAFGTGNFVKTRYHIKDVLQK